MLTEEGEPAAEPEGLGQGAQALRLSFLVHQARNAQTHWSTEHKMEMHAWQAPRQLIRSLQSSREPPGGLHSSPLPRGPQGHTRLSEDPSMPTEQQCC